MYEEHFGLTAPLLGNGIARDARVFAREPRLARIVQRIGGALARGNALVLLSGPAGTGKTTLAAHAVRTHATRLAFGWIAYAPGGPAELLEQLLAEFDLSPARASRAELLQTWQQFLNEMAVTETSVCVLVENADELDTPVLRALESLTAADPSGCPGANLVLMSRMNLAERLRGPELEGLVQRVGANLRFDALDAAGTADYLEFALSACGGRLDAIADEAAVRALHRHAGGIIRVIDKLTDNALALAAERGRERIDVALIDEIAAELAGEAPAPAAADPTTDVPLPDRTAEPEAVAASAAPELPPAALPDTEAETERTAELDDRAAAATPALPPAAEAGPRRGPLPATAPARDDVPVLTDAVDAGGDADANADGDALVRDVMASMSMHRAAAGDTPPDDAIPIAHDIVELEPDDARLAAPAATAGTDGGEPPPEDDDAQADTFEGLANALALEDLSNTMAETLFGDEELDALQQTLAVPPGATRPSKMTGT